MVGNSIEDISIMTTCKEEEFKAKADLDNVDTKDVLVSIQEEANCIPNEDGLYSLE